MNHVEAYRGLPPVNRHLEPAVAVPAAPLLSTMHALLNEAADVAGRIEGVADRAFGPAPTPGIPAGDGGEGDQLVDRARNLLMRLSQAADRLERII